MLEIQTADQIEAPWTTWFLYGNMGSGKTHAASTFPKPLFLVPANEGSELTLRQFTKQQIPFVRVGKRQDGTLVRAREHMSEILGELEKRHAEMFAWQDAADGAATHEERKAMLQKARDVFPWETLVVESLTHFGDMLVEDVSDFNKKKMDQQGWGLISNFFRTMHSRLRGMECHIVYTSLAKTLETEEGKIVSGGPNLIGATAEKLPSACDVVVYMEELQGPARKDGSSPPVYRAFLRKYRYWQARSRFAGFPDFVDDLRYEKLSDKLFTPKK